MLPVSCCSAGTYCLNQQHAPAFRSWESGLTQLAFSWSELPLAIAYYEYPTWMSSPWMILSTANHRLLFLRRACGASLIIAWSRSALTGAPLHARSLGCQRPTIYCRAAFERRYKKSLSSTRCKTLNSNRHIFARSASDGRRRTRGLSLSVQARPAPFCTRLDRRVAAPNEPSFHQIHG